MSLRHRRPLVLPASERLSIMGNVGLGLSTMDTDVVQIGRLPEQDLTKNYFTAEGGLRVGYDFFDDLGLFVEGRAVWLRPESEDFIALTAHAPDRLEPLKNAVVIPVSLGVEVDF